MDTIRTVIKKNGLTGVNTLDHNDWIMVVCRTTHSDEETDNFYNTIDKILEKQTHCTIVMGDFNAKVGGQTNTSERATGCFGLGQRNERGDTLVEWATSKNFMIMNTQFQKKAGGRWTSMEKP